MPQFDKYLELKKKYGEIDGTEALLLQYITILQTMAIYRRTYEEQSADLNNWLNNIEKGLKEKAKEVDGK